MQSPSSLRTITQSQHSRTTFFIRSRVLNCHPKIFIYLGLWMGALKRQLLPNDNEEKKFFRSEFTCLCLKIEYCSWKERRLCWERDLDSWDFCVYYCLHCVLLCLNLLYEVHTIILQTFFVWALLLIVHTWNSIPLRSNLLQLQCTCCTTPTTSGRPHRSPLVYDLRHSLFHLPDCLITTACELRE